MDAKVRHSALSSKDLGKLDGEWPATTGRSRCIQEGTAGETGNRFTGQTDKEQALSVSRSASLSSCSIWKRAIC